MKISSSTTIEYPPVSSENGPANEPILDGKFFQKNGISPEEFAGGLQKAEEIAAESGQGLSESTPQFLGQARGDDAGTVPPEVENNFGPTTSDDSGAPTGGPAPAQGSWLKTPAPAKEIPHQNFGPARRKNNS